MKAPASIRRRPSKILGPNGKPAAYFLYPSPRFNLRSYKPRYWLGADTKTNVSEFDRWEMVNYSRQLFAQVPTLYSAVMQKNAWAFGDAWDPHYCGNNKEWGKEVEEFLRHVFYPNANIRRGPYDLKWSLKTSGYMLDVDGDDAMVLTKSEDGLPALAFYPSTRIGPTASGLNSPMIGRSKYSGVSETIKGGPFDGAKTFDGVILDRNNRMIGLRITQEDADPVDIPSSSCDICYEPTWSDQIRGIPRIAVGMLRWMNIQDIDEFLQRGIKRASSVGVVVNVEEGEGGLGNEVITQEPDQISQSIPGANPANRQVSYEEIEGGEAWYLRANAGEKISGVDYQSPHPNTENFVSRIERGALSSLGWFYELLNLGDTSRAPTRLVCDLANMTIWERQSAGMRRWRKLIAYAIADSVESGLIPRNDLNSGLDQFMWEPGLPKQLSVDAGNDEQADRENFKLGTTSKTIIAQKKGLHRHEIRKQRLIEMDELIEDVREVMSKDKRISFDMAMGLLEQRTPNASPVPMAAPTPANNDESEN